jgi:hypothetical protein
MPGVKGSGFLKGVRLSYSMKTPAGYVFKRQTPDKNDETAIED